MYQGERRTNGTQLFDRKIVDIFKIIFDQEWAPSKHCNKYRNKKKVIKTVEILFFEIGCQNELLKIAKIDV